LATSGALYCGAQVTASPAPPPAKPPFPDAAHDPITVVPSVPTTLPLHSSVTVPVEVAKTQEPSGCAVGVIVSVLAPVEETTVQR
jgi:hypothetical protein